MALRLAMITQLIGEGSPVLGFTVGWVRELAKHVERLDVICLRQDSSDLPSNVRVMEMPHGKLGRYSFLKRYLRTAIEDGSTDAVFAHMCPIYAIAAGWILKGGMPLGLWYAHSASTLKLRLAVRQSQVVFSSSPSAMRIRTDKLVVTGNGIDTDLFRPSPECADEDVLVIRSVGRISRIKRYDTAIRAIGILAKRTGETRLRYEIFGPKNTSADEEYERELKALVGKLGLSDVVVFRGAIPYDRITQAYLSCDILLNLMPLSLDKSVLEACACGIPVVCANEAYREMFGEYARLLISESETPEGLSERLLDVYRIGSQARSEIGGYLRNQIIKYHSLDGLMRRITQEFEAILAK